MSSPAHKIRISNLSVTIWRNSSEKGTWYSVNPSRSYKKGDETWKETDSLGFDDLLTMAKLLDQAHTWIAEADAGRFQGPQGTAGSRHRRQVNRNRAGIRPARPSESTLMELPHMTTAVIAIARPKFPLGQIVITANALARLDPADVEQGLSRHARGDWGELPAEDARSNEQALTHGGRLFSSYGTGGNRFWIITEADRSVTTVLLPLDY